MTHPIADQDKEAITSVKREGNTSWNMRFFECGGGDIGETVQWYLSDGKRISLRACRTGRIFEPDPWLLQVCIFFLACSNGYHHARHYQPS